MLSGLRQYVIRHKEAKQVAVMTTSLIYIGKTYPRLITKNTPGIAIKIVDLIWLYTWTD